MSIIEMKKVIQHLVEESNDEAILEEAINVLKQSEKETNLHNWDDLSVEERKEMLDAIARAENVTGTISWEDYKLKNLQ